jgi:hypothetical protein
MNMKFAAATVLGLLSLAALAPAASAADNGFYLGAGITDTKFDIDGLGSGSLDDNGFKVIGGFRPLNWLAFEANYLDLGGEEANGDSLDASAITLSGLVLAEIGIVDIYGRVGVAKWDADVSSNALNFSDSDDGWEPTYGVGIGVHFGSIGVRAEYERFEAEFFDALDTDVSTVSLSVTYTFL